MADDARMALAQAALMQGDFETTQRRLGEVNSQSKRYASALQVQGQVRWRQYLTAKTVAGCRITALPRSRSCARRP